MYTYIYIYLHVCRCHICLYVYIISVYIYTHLLQWIYAALRRDPRCTPLWICINIFISVCRSIQIYIYTYMYIYLHICICICKYIYTYLWQWIHAAFWRDPRCTPWWICHTRWIYICVLCDVHCVCVSSCNHGVQRMNMYTQKVIMGYSEWICIHKKSSWGTANEYV